MSTKTRRAIQREADFVACFTRSYRLKLAGLIDGMNAALHTHRAGQDLGSMRCCIEAVDLVLASHEEFAKSLAAGLSEA